MADYLSIERIVALSSEAGECVFKQLPRKKILFVGKKPNGETVTLCTPQSKFHPQGFYWVDITEKQCNVLNETDKALIVFRLEGKKLVMVQWSELKKYMLPECMRYNNNEQNHWKLNIYVDHIKVSGNENECKIQMIQ